MTRQKSCTCGHGSSDHKYTQKNYISKLNGECNLPDCDCTEYVFDKVETVLRKNINPVLKPIFDSNYSLDPEKHRKVLYMNKLDNNGRPIG